MRTFRSARGLTSQGEVVNLVDMEVRDQRWRLIATTPEQQPHPHASGHTEARVMRSSLAALSESIRHTCPDATGPWSRGRDRPPGSAVCPRRVEDDATADRALINIQCSSVNRSND